MPDGAPADPQSQQQARRAVAAPPAARLHIWQIQAVRDLLWVTAVVLLLWLGYALRAVTVPLLVALLLAYLFEPLVARLSSHPRVSRPMVVAGLVFAFVVSVAILLAVIVPLIVGQSVRLVKDFRTGQLERLAQTVRPHVPEAYKADFDNAVEYFEGLLGRPPGAGAGTIGAGAGDAAVAAGGAAAGAAVAEGGGGAAPPVIADPSRQLTAEQVREMVRAEVAAQLQQQDQESPVPAPVTGVQLSDWLTIARRGAEAIVAFLGRVLQVGFLLFLIPFYFFFFSVWYPRVLAFGAGMIPPANRPRVHELLSKMDRAVAGFVRGRIVISLLVGLMLAIGWTICGVPYAIVLGLVIGVFSVVPYLGGVGIPLAVGLLWVRQLALPADEQMSWMWIIAGPVLVFGIVQVIEAYWLTPVIAGKATNLDPVTILVAVLAGGSVAGVYGMLIAIPLAACAKILLAEVLLPRVRAWLSGGAADPLPLR